MYYFNAVYVVKLHPLNLTAHLHIFKLGLLVHGVFAGVGSGIRPDGGLYSPSLQSHSPGVPPVGVQFLPLILLILVVMAEILVAREVFRKLEILQTQIRVECNLLLERFLQTSS